MDAPNGSDGLVVQSLHPLNAETPLALLGERVTPVPSVFVRCHFEVPRLDPASFRLVVDGEVARPLALGLDELRAGRVVERRVTFECAGNGRSAVRPAPPGIAWDLGAASTVVVATGTPLADICARAGLADGAREIVCTAYCPESHRGASRGCPMVEVEQSTKTRAA
jgi:DMSO/TMAO reductase YedYZ molybdopterin-dependent catalytic subunit